MPRVKQSVSNARELAVLACVRSHLDGPEGAVVSIADVASDTGLSLCQARSALQRLSRKGALSTVPRSYPSGATAENSYRITRGGFAQLDAVDGALGAEGSARGDGCGA